MLVEQNEKVHTDLWQVKKHVIDLESSIIREILKISSQPGVISFAGGLPAPELFPIGELQAIASDILEKHGADCLQYSLTRGIVPLRELLAERAAVRGTPTNMENILVTSGAQQAIELVARAFIEPGDYIITENPTYVGALQAFNYYQARYDTIEIDDNGMLVDELEDRILKHRPKLIYTVSNFQNPSGVSMSEKRRVQLVDIATRYNVPIIDDNPYGDIFFSGRRLKSLKAIGGDEVIALRSFSKTLTPGLRIGWMNGPADIMSHFEKVKQCTDLHTSTFGQYLVYEYLKRGLLEPHIEEIKADYGAKRDLMLKEMQEHFPPGVKWTHPEGGLFLWVELPQHVSAKDLLPKAIASKVAYVYGEPFYANGGGKNTLRLNFSNANHDDIVTGIKKLGKLFSENI